MEYKVLSDPEDLGLEKVFESQAGAIEKALRRPVDKHIVTEVKLDGGASSGRVGLILEEKQDIQKATFMLSLLKL